MLIGRGHDNDESFYIEDADEKSHWCFQVRKSIAENILGEGNVDKIWHHASIVIRNIGIEAGRGVMEFC